MFPYLLSLLLVTAAPGVNPLPGQTARAEALLAALVKSDLKAASKDLSVATF